ncbi:MAG: NAD(P)-dependent oxidoreductase [Dysgonomonas sp.]|nr:NAD(P)-dependent oxidoreductase [Dysgonomonas sp.]
MKCILKITLLAGILALLPGIVFSQSSINSNNGKKMKIMVTGHKGFIGGHFVQAFADRYEIVGYDLKDGDDILDYDKLKERMKGCEVVVHEAAIPAPVPGKSYDDYMQTNVMGTLNVLKAAHENGVKRVVYASSTTVYGIEGGIPFSYPITEGQKFVSQYLKADQLSCRDIDLSYHTSKVMAEQMVAWYGLNKKIQTIALRYGPTEHVNLGAHVSIPNVLQATRLAVNSPKEFWYEAFSIVDGDVDYIDISKAREMLGYKPESATYPKDKVVTNFEDRLKLDKH